MTIAASQDALTPERRTALFYVTVFMSGGASATALPLWLHAMGMNSEQIGVINAAPVFAMLLINMLVGRVADKASDWRQVIVYASILAAFLSMALFFVSDFWGIVVVWTLITLPNAGIAPVLDAAATRLTRRRGSDFGALRAWGTVGYMALNAVAGFVVAGFGPYAFVPLLVLVTFLRAGVSLVLPRFRDREAEAAQPPKAVGRLREILKPWFVLPLVGFALIFSSHALFNAFCTLIWVGQGIPEAVVGPLVALAAFSEAVLMFVWRRFARKVTARHLIMIAGTAAAVRWIGTAMAPPLAVIVILQLGHAVTYALGFLGCIAFIGNWTSDDIAAQAQGFFMVVQQSATVIALLGFGWVYAGLGIHAFYLVALVALLGVGCVYVSLKMQQPKG